MDHFIFNGKILKTGTPVAGPDNRGLRYGDGVFETMKLVNGQLQLADEHFARLWKGMELLQFDRPKLFTPEKLTAEIVQLTQKNKHERAARIRLQVIRGDGGLYDPANHLPQYIIQSWALPENHGSWISNGLITGLYEDAKKSCDRFSNCKHNNYLPYAMAALFAKQQKWNDAFVLNSYNRICDSTIANIFTIKNNIFHTPALTEGCVAGIMRQHIIHTLKKNGHSVNETTIRIDDLMEADEVFLSNSLYNIRWVQEIAGKKFSNILTQKIFPEIISTIA